MKPIFYDMFRYIICDSEGTILRRLPSMSLGQAEKYAECMKQLISKATNLARDLNPRDKLCILRIRTKKKEIIVSHDKNVIVTVIQQWSQYLNS